MTIPAGTRLGAYEIVAPVGAGGQGEVYEARDTRLDRQDSEIATEGRPLTEEGAILGTVQYMAPEQLEGREADSRTDLFALGAVLYEMVTGRKAFHGESTATIITAIMSGEPRPLTELQPVSPPLLDHLVNRCLAKDPRKRWQSARGI